MLVAEIALGVRIKAIIPQEEEPESEAIQELKIKAEFSFDVSHWVNRIQCAAHFSGFNLHKNILLYKQSRVSNS